MSMKRYRTLREHLKQQYGEKLVKICIDGGFTCPNRDGRAGSGGCIFCGAQGAGENIFVDGEYPAASVAVMHSRETDGGGSDIGFITAQVRSFLDNPSAVSGANKFIAYFQSFSNTYAPVSVLRARYDAALIDDRIIVLSVGTRPDCIDEEIAALLSTYKDRYDVWVELGLQTVSDETGRRINRGYATERFTEAVTLLRRYGIEVIAHMMIGLPGETPDDVMATVSFLNRHDLSGVKLHALYVMEGTLLAELTRSGEYTPISEKEYVRLAAEAIARLDPRFVLHRVTGDCRRDLLVAPAWNVHKIRVIRAIDRFLEERGWYQGCLGEGDTVWEQPENSTTKS